MGTNKYQLMFGCKAQTPYNWLLVFQYDCSKFVSKSSWIQEKDEIVWASNHCTLKGISQSTQESALEVGGKPLQILEANFVDAAWPSMKIQYHSKDQEFIMVGKHPEQNVYNIKAVNNSAPVWTVNQEEIQALQKTHEERDFISWYFHGWSKGALI